MVVTGEKGCFVADTVHADLTFFANGSIAMEWESMSIFRGVAEGDVVRYALARPEPLRTELQAFRDAVLGSGERIVTVEEGTRTVAVAEALLASAASGATVQVPPLQTRADVPG